MTHVFFQCSQALDIAMKRYLRKAGKGGNGASGHLNVLLCVNMWSATTQGLSMWKFVVLYSSGLVKKSKSVLGADKVSSERCCRSFQFWKYSFPQYPLSNKKHHHGVTKRELRNRKIILPTTSTFPPLWRAELMSPQSLNPWPDSKTSPLCRTTDLSRKYVFPLIAD